uniref:Uncharacterized protein n=1 Tax=Oryza barthii TaxID=65489 RepID=A0A0D3GKK8_9ORYZ
MAKRQRRKKQDQLCMTHCGTYSLVSLVLLARQFAVASTEQQEHAAPLLQPEVEEAYTSDGSLDIDGNPALKHRTGGWRACRSILGAEFCYCLANNGIMYNLVTYLTTQLHQSNVAAAKNVSIWKATCFLTPLAGAVVADSYWGGTAPWSSPAASASLSVC